VYAAPPMRRFYTTYEAAHLLGVSLPTVVNWVKARRLKAHRTPGGHRRIAREELAGFMLRHGIPLPNDLADAVESRRKALVVGDDDATRDGALRTLEAAGFSVEAAPQGFAAGLAAARFAPDVVVLLATDPDGGDTLSGLRRDDGLSSIPVVAVSAAEWAPRLRAAGCTVMLPHAAGDGSLAAAALQVLSAATVGARRR
jgi:excisionase family DNA binding protein